MTTALMEFSDRELEYESAELLPARETLWVHRAPATYSHIVQGNFFSNNFSGNQLSINLFGGSSYQYSAVGNNSIGG